jgi:hypothetical protein
MLPSPLQESLYLPPTTGIMRMPATRTPAGGLIAAAAAGSAPPGRGAAGAWASGKKRHHPLGAEPSHGRALLKDCLRFMEMSVGAIRTAG